MALDRIKIVVGIKKSLLLDGLAAWLGNDARFKVVGKCSTGTECVEAIKTTKPEIVILGTNIVASNYIETALIITQEVPESKIIVLAKADDYHDILAGFRAGSRAYLSEDIDMSELARDIARVNAGEIIISQQLSQIMLEEMSALPVRNQTANGASVPGELSPREMQILGLVAKGKTNKEIGMSLSISENTVKTHISKIMEKMHAHNRHEITMLALEKNLIDTISIRG